MSIETKLSALTRAVQQVAGELASLRQQVRENQQVVRVEAATIVDPDSIAVVKDAAQGPGGQMGEVDDDPHRPPPRAAQRRSGMFTSDEVRDIRTSGKSHAAEGRQRGVSDTTISNIRKRLSYAHVPAEPGDSMAERKGHGRRFFTTEEVQTIREGAEPALVLASRFGVERNTINNIQRAKSYARVPNRDGTPYVARPLLRTKREVSDEDVRIIRGDARPEAVIAKEHGVTSEYVNRIKRELTRKAAGGVVRWAGRKEKRTLTNDEVRQLYALRDSGRPQDEVGDEFEVTAGYVSQVWCGHARRDITGAPRPKGERPPALKSKERLVAEARKSMTGPAPRELVQKAGAALRNLSPNEAAELNILINRKPITPGEETERTRRMATLCEQAGVM